MKDYAQPGETVEVTAPYAVNSGDGALVGSLFGIATHNAANAALVNLFVGPGIVWMKKTSAQAWTAGALIYWDNTAKEATNTSAAGVNKLIGVAIGAAANPTANGQVRLNGSFTT